MTLSGDWHTVCGASRNHDLGFTIPDRRVQLTGHRSQPPGGG